MSGGKQFIVVLLELLASFGIALFPNWTGIEFTPADQVVVGMTLFSALLLINVLILLRTVAATKQKELEQWLLDTELDGALGTIRKHYASIARKRHGADDLFVAHFKREVTVLEDDLRKAARNSSAVCNAMRRGIMLRWASCAISLALVCEPACGQGRRRQSVR